jgi:hypothetical protein
VALSNPGAGGTRSGKRFISNTQGGRTLCTHCIESALCAGVSRREVLSLVAGPPVLRRSWNRFLHGNHRFTRMNTDTGCAVFGCGDLWFFFFGVVGLATDGREGNTDE